MPLECSICADPRVADIDRALDGGASQRDIAKRFGCAKSSVARHALHRRRADTSPRPAAGAELEPSPGRRPCLVCRSPERDVIEAAILSGEPADAIERAHGSPSADTIRRHATSCIPDAIRQAREVRGTQLVERARDAIEELTRHARELLAVAQGDGVTDDDGRRVAGTIRERAAAIGAAARAFELLGKLTGELGPDVEIKILQLPQWAAIQAVLLEALEPYPEATDAVIAALRRAEQGALALPAAREGA